MADEQGPGSELTLEASRPSPRARRRALWGALAAVAVAAGALVVVAGGGDGDPPDLPISLATARPEASGAADMALAWVTYVAGDDLPALGGTAAAYRLRADVGEDDLRAVAEILGLDGEVQRTPTSYEMARDGDLLSLDLATGTWWYSRSPDAAVASGPAPGDGSAPAAGTTDECVPGPAVDCSFGEPTTTTIVDPDTPSTDCGPDGCATEPAEPCPPGAACDPSVPETIPPADDLPSREEARRIALDLLAATGMDVADARVTVDGGYDSWFVSVEPVLDGVPLVGWAASVTIGSEGELIGASGAVGEPERQGDYPLVDTRAAIDRLNAQQGLPMPAPGQPAPADAPTTDETGVADVPVTEPGTVRCDPADTTCATTTTAPPPPCEVPEGGSGDCAAAAAPVTAPCNPDATAGDPTSCEQASQGAGADACIEPYPSPCGDEPGCAVQPDGTEICEVPADPGQEPVPVEPLPEPAPIEVVLTGAERVLIVSVGGDGTGATYLVPGYRMTSDDGHLVDVVAVADDAIATTTVPETTIPPTDEPPVTEPAPEDCQVLVEDDGSGTTHTVQTCPGQPPAQADPVLLGEGEAPEIGVGYFVDGVNTHCGWFVWAGRWWATDEPTPLPWASPTEGGTFTLAAPDEGTFVGDAARTKVAAFTARGPADELPLCE